METQKRYQLLTTGNTKPIVNLKLNSNLDVLQEKDLITNLINGLASSKGRSISKVWNSHCIIVPWSNLVTSLYKRDEQDWNVADRNHSVRIICNLSVSCTSCLLYLYACHVIQKHSSGNAYLETDLSFGLKDQEMIFKVGSTTWHEVRVLICSFNYKW